MKTCLILMLAVVIAGAREPALEPAGAKVRVAGVGASITYGAGLPDRAGPCYPAQLQNLLGGGGEVRNFGVNSTTLLKKGDAPDWHTAAGREALAFNPGIVVMDLGGNDSKPQNWPFLDQGHGFTDHIHPNAEGTALMAKLVGGAIATTAAAPAPAGPPREMVLWYRQPAEKWLEALPLGNGLIGAMVFGGTQSDRIALNESTFWSGRPHDYDNPEAFQYFPRIRELVVAGRFQEAEKMADEHFYGVPAAQQAYQPLGDLLFACGETAPVEDYRRELDLETGVARITYRARGVRHAREVFVSHPDRVLVVRFTADQPGRVSLQATFKSPFQDTVAAQSGQLLMDGCWKGPITNNWLIGRVEGQGLRFQARLVARLEGGYSEAAGGSLRIHEANSATLIVAAATSFLNYHDIGGDPAAACGKVLAGVADQDYNTLLRRHVQDFGGLMGRVRLRVGDAARNEAPTNERLQAVREGGSDPNLEALCFQFGRYLLAASSRAGGQAANLQGIWNEAVSPPWGSKYTININTEMNYWAAETGNLPECHQPLFELLKDISVTGARTAKTYYGGTGWVAHHNLDLWRGTAPVDAARFGMWPMGGAWLCQHLWEHYAFTGDHQFLQEYYPIMRGAARFLLGLLVEDPRHHWLVTPFSMSPEHGFLDASGRMAFLSPAPTMDMAIIRELFPHCIAASQELGVDAEFRGQLEAALKRLPPYQTNRLGFLREWPEDWQPGNQGHNMSPHFTFYPGSSITLRGTPELAAVIRRGMEARRSRGGWPLAWDLCMWARLERGDQVAASLRTLLRNSLAPNLHNSGSNQSDASFGLTAGVAEALLQSHAGELSLLPALPDGWADGSVQGLRARGGAVVNMTWKNGKLHSAEIRNARGPACPVRSGEKTTILHPRPGETIRLNANLEATD
jgi:alpha-L-fucosidase 2